MTGEAEHGRRPVDEAAQLGLHIVRQADRLVREAPTHALARKLQGVGAAGGDPLPGPAAPAEILGGPVAAQPAARVTRTEEARPWR